MASYVLFETASGLALFQQLEGEEIASAETAASFMEYNRLAKALKLKAFNPFPSAEVALDNAAAISEGLVTEFLRNFLEANLPKEKKSKSGKNSFILALQDPKLAASLQEEMGFSCDASSKVMEITRALRFNFTKFLPQLNLVGRQCLCLLEIFLTVCFRPRKGTARIESLLL
jgi:nucleolar protein 56